MVKELMIPLNSMMKSEKYQQDKVILIQLVVCWIIIVQEKYH